uniref:S-acyltransferase n=1 Tax=Tetradesmus obliquus TaxID=3088 RepID=A0A383W6T4_TETOB|eukprot:jgi/Sobl393_1/8884/SZX73358.1
MAKEPRGAQKRLRVYEQWQGNERFFCWGHCVTGPSWKSGMGSLLLLIAPTVVFLVFVAPYMSRKVTPAIMVVSCILPVFCAAMLLMTSCRDPGILPRQEPDEEWLQGRKPRARDVMVNGHRVTVRYNDTCHFFQPPRAHHCSVNDNCIERFDHHCPWVGTTIGKRNYRTFLMFIYSTSVYIAWTFGVSLGSLFIRHRELAAAVEPGSQESFGNNLWLQTLGQSGAAIALMIFTFIFFWFVCGLSGFHTWLVATNQTTYENFRYNHNQVPNPYDEGFFSNCASVWCVRVPPSKVQFRAFVDEVQRLPVEMGYSEWNSAALGSSMRANMAELNHQQQQQQQQSYAAGSPAAASAGALGGVDPADAAAATVAAAQERVRLGGLGNREAVLPMQGYDSLTEQSSAAPISREHARSGHNMVTGEPNNSQRAVTNTANNNSSNAPSPQPAAWSHNPYYNPNSEGLELAGLQSPGLQSPASHSPTHSVRQQQQQQQQQLAAPGMQAMQGVGVAGQQWAAAPRQQQAQQLPRTLSPLGGGAVGSAAASPDHVGLELPAAAAAAANGNSWGSGSSSSKLQQHADFGLTSPRGVAQPQQQQQQRSSQPGGAGPELAAGLGAGVSAQTEYHDAKSRQSEGSWASGREDAE